MKGKLQGTYPRRLVKRTHNNNPTFHSFNVLGVLNFDSNPQNWTPQASAVQNTKQSTYLQKNNDLDKIYSIKKPIDKTLFISPDNYYLANLHKKQIKSNQLMPDSFSRPRSKSTNKFELDSLNEAEDEFTKNRHRNPLNYISGRFQSSNKIEPSLTYDVTPKERSISEKQKAQYNIINFSHI